MSLSHLTDRATRLIATLPASARDLYHQDLDAMADLARAVTDETIRAADAMKEIADRNRHRTSPDGYVNLGVRDSAEWTDAQQALLDADRALQR
jgi:hypothetical protein